ncbi:MAG: hypothetical protein AAGE03_05350 [Pseudomonadota bacterium]
MTRPNHAIRHARAVGAAFGLLVAWPAMAEVIDLRENMLVMPDWNGIPIYASVRPSQRPEDSAAKWGRWTAETAKIAPDLKARCNADMAVIDEFTYEGRLVTIAAFPLDFPGDPVALDAAPPDDTVPVELRLSRSCLLPEDQP